MSPSAGSRRATLRAGIGGAVTIDATEGTRRLAFSSELSIGIEKEPAAELPASTSAAGAAWEKVKRMAWQAGLILTACAACTPWRPYTHSVLVSDAPESALCVGRALRSGPPWADGCPAQRNRDREPCPAPVQRELRAAPRRAERKSQDALRRTRHSKRPQRRAAARRSR
jgi:hypothetical protein